MAAAINAQREGLAYNMLKSPDVAELVGQDQGRFVEDVPAGFPPRYTGERVWTGADIAAKQQEWILYLSVQDLGHIREALRHFQALGIGPGSMSRMVFPLPQELADRLETISHDCYNGRGFAVLRGLRPEELTEEQNVLTVAGISSYIAPQRGFQDINRQQVTCHVISEELKPGAWEQGLRPAFTNERLAFHTDLGDILTLYTVGASKDGGQTMIASSSQIYNELAESRPDLLLELSKKWVFFRSQDYDTDGTPLITNVDGDKLAFQFSRLPITGFRTLAGNSSLPPVTPARLEAMALIEKLASKHAFPLPGESGDIAYINNLCLLHGRTAFDLDKAGNPLPSRRHLVKLILRNPKSAWKLPDSLAWLTERVFGSNQPDGTRTEKWHLSIGDDLLPDGRIWAGSGSVSNG